MLRALGFGAPEVTDINKEIYDPNNQRHIEYVDERLKNFIAKRDAMLSFDKKVAAAMGLDTLVWLSGFTGGWGPYLALAGYLAIYLAAKEKYGRDQVKQEFHDALNEMFAVYYWYAKGKGPALTFDPGYQKLLSAILPFTLDWRKLIFWEMGRLNKSYISPLIVEMFEQSPHAAAAALLKLDVEPKPAQDPVLPAVLPDPKGWVVNSRPYLFFAETTANAKLKIYGQRFEDGITGAYQLRKG